MGRTYRVSQLAFVAILNLVAYNVLVGFVLGCHDVERQALSMFKLSFFSDPYENFSSWKGMDCCHWEGVACDNVTGSVNRLDLSSTIRLSALKLDPSLMVLRHLNYLDLSYNDFHGSQIPGFIGSFKHLEYLDLSYANFSAVLPPQLGNLTRLQHLGLSRPNGDYSQSAFPLANSQHMEMNDVLISNTRNTLQVLTNLPSLTYLSLSSCGLVSSPHFHTILSNSTWLHRIETLDLSFNLLTGPLSNIYANMSSLEYLDLSVNFLNGSIPLWVRNLEHLLLSRNSFSQVEGGAIMGILETSSKLEELDLDSNSLEGELGGQHVNFSKGVTLNLTFLRLSNNRISGHIPASIGNLSALVSLELYNNNLDGVIPEALGQLINLEFLDLSFNLLEGVISNSHLANLSCLDNLKLISNNRLNLKFSDDWSPPFQLLELHMSSCIIGAQLPRWIKSQTIIKILDLSNTDISRESLYFLCKFTHLISVDLHRNQFFGTIPDCLSINNSSLALADFSSNKLSGPIPQSIGQLEMLYLLYLNNNSLEGEIPHSLSLLSNLIIMDVGENNLSGSIPDLKSNNLRHFKFLRMRSNKLVGVIPESLCTLPSIQLLDLANNNLTGTIPRCFGHLGGMDLASSAKTINGLPPNLSYSFPSQQENIVEVLKGEERRYTRNLKFLVDLDLSSNKLVGSIPDSITNLVGLIGLNLSHNHLTGGIPHKIGEMSSLESLDLSNNHLNGSIPSSLAVLTSLSSFNLSNNQLTGLIPTGNQLQTLVDPSIYAGNPGLCGDPLPNKCRTANAQPKQPQQQQESDKDDGREKILLYFVIFSGFATGFWGFVGSLFLKRRFRFALFHIVNNVTDYFYVQIMVRINRFRG